MTRWSAPNKYNTPPKQGVIPKQKKAAPPGKELENKFDKWLEYWNTIPGVLAIRLHVARTYNGNVHKEKQPCDYMVVRARNGHDEVWLIDSKECSSKKFYPKRQAKHQRDAFEDAKRNGRVGGFVVWFKEQDPAMVNLRFITDMVTPATIEDGVRFDWGNFFS